MDRLQLKGRKALVVGGSRGIGRAIAELFLQNGAEVAIASRNPASVARAVDDFRDSGYECVSGWPVDVCDQESVDQLLDSVVAAFGGLDILVNSAGIAGIWRTRDCDPQAWCRIIETNLNGTFRVIHAVLARSGMLERGFGRIINIASTAGKQGVSMGAAYAASKHGVVGLTKSLGFELARTGVTVNAICPGVVDTEMSRTADRQYAAIAGLAEQEARARVEQRVPLGRYLDAGEVAPLALYLASDESSAVIGQAWNVCGGLGGY